MILAISAKKREERRGTAKKRGGREEDRRIEGGEERNMEIWRHTCENGEWGKRGKIGDGRREVGGEQKPRPSQ